MAFLKRLRFRPHQSLQFRVGLFIFAASAFLPLMSLRDYPLNAIALFGWGAEMTALGTIGLLLATQGARIGLILAPVLYLVVAILIEIN